MDTISHIAMGTGIAAIAVATSNIDPQYNVLTYSAIISGSLIHDIDIVTKLAGNKSYINNHRGFTHSIIFLGLFTIIYYYLIGIFITGMPQVILTLWTLLAMIMHLVTDLFNNYGVKLLWPFSDRWFSISATYTVDYFILISFVAGIISVYIFRLNAKYIFIPIFIASIAYLIILAIRRNFIIKYIKNNLSNTKKVFLTSKSLFHHWKFVAESYDGIYIIGDLQGKKLSVLQTQQKHQRIDDELFEIIKEDKNLQIFRKFSKVYNWDIKKRQHITEVRLKDLAYYTKINKEYIYVFNCVIYVNNHTKQIENTYVGFTTGDQNLYDLVEHKTGIKSISRRLTNFFKKNKGELK